MKKQKRTHPRDKGNPYERLAHRLLIEALRDAMGASMREQAQARYWLLYGVGADIAELCDMSYGVTRVVGHHDAVQLARVAYG